MAATRRVVTEKGYSESEASGPSTLVFKQGLGVFYVGKDIIVRFEALSPAVTRLKVTATTAAVFDYGSSKRETHGILEALGAKRVEEP